MIKALYILKKTKEGNFTPYTNENSVKIDEAIKEIENSIKNEKKIKIPAFPIMIIFSFVLWINHIIGKPDEGNIDIMALWHQQLWVLHFMLIALIVLNEFYKILKDK